MTPPRTKTDATPARYTFNEREGESDQRNGPESVGDVPIYRPEHYARWKIEPITFIMGNDMEYWRGAVVKYACRAGGKTYDGLDAAQSEIADLEKARRYCEMRINQIKGKEVL